jgi:hypothetical protein
MKTQSAIILDGLHYSTYCLLFTFANNNNTLIFDTFYILDDFSLI